MLAGLMTLCLVLLIVAPRAHRRVLERVRRSSAREQQRRIDDLRTRSDVAEIGPIDAAIGARVRDTLLLRGVRVELVEASGGARLVYAAEYAADVEAVVAELATPPG